MVLTQTHLSFWDSKRRPRWAGQINRQLFHGTIDACINDHAGIRETSRALAVGNLLVLCESYRRRGVLREKLAELTTRPGTVIEPITRAVTARRWLRRLARVS